MSRQHQDTYAKGVAQLIQTALRAADEGDGADLCAVHNMLLVASLEMFAVCNRSATKGAAKAREALASLTGNAKCMAEIEHNRQEWLRELDLQRITVQ